MSQGWVVGQLAAAFSTAVTHENAETRRRAEERVARWGQTLQAIAEGRVRVGSRTPVRGLPAWATLEVMRGGFASGKASAEGPIEPDELELANDLGIHATRAALFAWLLTDDGVEHCWSLLDSGRYVVRVPEDAALLTVSWLLRAGDLSGALDVLDALAPLSSRLRFLPREGVTPLASDHVHRRSVADARVRLLSRPLQPQVERQREALSIWNPFTDRLLDLWWGTDERAVRRFDAAWQASAAAILVEYAHLARVHTLCTKHRDPRENLARLLHATRAALAGPLTDGMRTMVDETVARMVAKRGKPGSAAVVELRLLQHSVAAAPRHGEVAAVVAQRLADVPQDQGLTDPGQWQQPVSPDEALATGVRAGTPLPKVVHRVLQPTMSAPAEVLVMQGVVPSAEVLAELLPQVTAVVVAEAFADPAMARLAGATYRAFRARRSLLLLNLARQVQVSELPWVRAAAAHARTDRPDDALDVGRRVAALALDGFPGVLLPNPLVRELDHLFRAGGHKLSLVEELAADIFEGRFGRKYLAAARSAGRLMTGTVYERYYGLNYAGLGAGGRVGTPSRWRRFWGRKAGGDVDLAALCIDLAHVESADRSVARNGSIIEWSQVLGTHNIAQLVADGVRPAKPWAQLADEAWSRCQSLLELAMRQPRPLSTIKDAAYAWRQAICFMALEGPSSADEFLQRSLPTAGSWAASQVLGGLRHVVAGGEFDADGGCEYGTRLTGWTVGPHWALGGRRC